MDFTHSVERIEVLQPGFGLYNVRNVLLSTRIRSQSWRSMLGVYSKGSWILLFSIILLIIVLLGLSSKKESLWQNLLMAKIATVKSIFAQSFDQEIFFKVSTTNMKGI